MLSLWFKAYRMLLWILGVGSILFVVGYTCYFLAILTIR